MQSQLDCATAGEATSSQLCTIPWRLQALESAGNIIWQATWRVGTWNECLPNAPGIFHGRTLWYTFILSSYGENWNHHDLSSKLERSEQICAKLCCTSAFQEIGTDFVPRTCLADFVPSPRTCCVASWLHLGCILYLLGINFCTYLCINSYIDKVGLPTLRLNRLARSKNQVPASAWLRLSTGY